MLDQGAVNQVHWRKQMKWALFSDESERCPIKRMPTAKFFKGNWGRPTRDTHLSHIIGYYHSDSFIFGQIYLLMMQSCGVITSMTFRALFYRMKLKAEQVRTWESKPPKELRAQRQKTGKIILCCLLSRLNRFTHQGKMKFFLCSLTSEKHGMFKCNSHSEKTNPVICSRTAAKLSHLLGLIFLPQWTHLEKKLVFNSIMI